VLGEERFVQFDVMLEMGNALLGGRAERRIGEDHVVEVPARLLRLAGKAVGFLHVG
jgi:hypothetical protein